ncbi:phage holin [Bifidobacterium cuniculi]|uniref:Holin, SPP1 family n=1 Tax=Bifidobacterium cuniculi TaxID=1688 RepID=A0A087AWA5_9BIFI|nr:phage holin [Bifidobacterium cuniculi]KFI63055.1 holin, SPP1 family [Bifidobacterium cuniculi]
MAEHAKETNTTSIGKERAQAIATLVVSLYSMVSAGCALAGLNPLPFTTDQVSAGVFSVISVIAVIYAWWKDQNLTHAGLEGSVVTRSIKLAQQTGNAVDMPDRPEPVSYDHVDEDDDAFDVEDGYAPVTVEGDPMTPVDDGESVTIPIDPTAEDAQE